MATRPTAARAVPAVDSRNGGAMPPKSASASTCRFQTHSAIRLSEVGRVVPIEVVRDASFLVLGLLALPRPGMLAFVEDEAALATLRRTEGVACVIAKPEFSGRLDAVSGVACSPSPRPAFWRLHNHLAEHTQFYWEDFPSEIHPTAKVHPRAYVADQNVRIGAGTVIGPNASIEERSLIGASVVIHAGAVIGAAGFQSSRSGGQTVEMVHAGGVRIEDRVHILANAVIARAVFGEFTTIGSDARIGNVSFVSHSVQVGAGSFVGHGAVVNGNVVIGRDAWIGPGGTLVQCIRVGDRARVSPGSAVISDVAAGRRVTGNIAVDHFQYLRHLASFGLRGQSRKG